jgi:hypothetical protein
MARLAGRRANLPKTISPHCFISFQRYAMVIHAGQLLAGRAVIDHLEEGELAKLQEFLISLVLIASTSAGALWTSLQCIFGVA